MWGYCSRAEKKKKKEENVKLENMPQGNAVTHTLAKRARMSYPLSVWMNSVPPDIFYLVYIDVPP